MDPFFFLFICAVPILCDLRLSAPFPYDLPWYLLLPQPMLIAQMSMSAWPPVFHNFFDRMQFSMS